MLYLAAHQLPPPELLELKQKDRGDHTRFREAEKSKPSVNQRFVQSHLHSSLGWEEMRAQQPYPSVYLKGRGT